MATYENDCTSGLNLTSAQRVALGAGYTSYAQFTSLVDPTNSVLLLTAALAVTSTVTGDISQHLGNAVQVASSAQDTLNTAQNAMAGVVFHSAVEMDFGANLVSHVAATSAAAYGVEIDIVNHVNVGQTLAPQRVHYETLLNKVHLQSAYGSIVAASLASDLNATSAMNFTEDWALRATFNVGDSHTLGSTVNFPAKSGVNLTNATTTVVQAVNNETSTVDVENAASYPDPLAPAYWTNAETMGAARWTGVPFAQYAQLGDKLAAIKSDGVYVFSADDDSGTPIESMVVGDEVNFGDPKIKRWDSAFVSATAAGPMIIRVETEQGVFDYQTHLPSSTTYKNHRAKFGGGLRSEYARISHLNLNGQDFDVSTILVDAPVTARRI